MHILLVDNNQFTCENLIRCVKEVFPNEKISFFSDPILSIKHGINNPVEIFIAPLEMQSVSSEEITRILRTHHPDLYSVYIVNPQKAKVNSFAIEPDSILTVPVTTSKLKEAINC